MKERKTQQRRAAGYGDRAAQKIAMMILSAQVKLSTWLAAKTSSCSRRSQKTALLLFVVSGSLLCALQPARLYLRATDKDNYPFPGMNQITDSIQAVPLPDIRAAKGRITHRKNSEQ